MTINWRDYADKSKAGKKRAVHITDSNEDVYIYWPIEDGEIDDLVCWFEGVDLAPLVAIGDRRFEVVEQCPLCGVTTCDWALPALEWCNRCDENDPA